MDGEIQIIPANNAAVTGTDQTATSTLWMAIMPDGSLVAPGTAGTLKWDLVSATTSGAFTLNTVIANPAAAGVNGAISFAGLTANAGVTIPEILKKLAIMPVDSGDHGGDSIYMNNNGECLGSRGGAWGDVWTAGVFVSSCSNPRSFANASVGFRSAFIA